MKSLVLPLGLAGLLLVAPPAQGSEQIATKAGCNACHAAAKKVIGPSYRDIAAKYKGRADAPALLAKSVREGSKDRWGPVAMPPTDKTKLADADLKAVVAWVLQTH